MRVASPAGWIGVGLQVSTSVVIAGHAWIQETGWDRGFGGIALLAVLSAPAALAAAGLRRARLCLVAAALATVMLAFFPVSAHTPTFVLAAVAYLLAYDRAPENSPVRQRAMGLITAPALALLASVMMQVHEDRRCWTAPEQSATGLLRECSSNVVTWWEATLAVALSLVMVGVVSWLLRPQDSRNASPQSARRQGASTGGALG